MTRLSSSAGPVLAALLLSCALCAQTPTQLPGQANPTSPGAQAPGAQAPGLQQPAAKKDDKSPAPNLPAPTGENQQFYEVKVSTNNTEIKTDPGATPGLPLSFLTPGKNVTADFTVFQDQSFGNVRFQFLSIVRSNNDPRVDPESNSLQRGYVKLIGPRTELSVGDALVSYSRLTYNQNIKGVNFARKFGGHFRVMANAGVFTDRWGSIWKDDLIGKPYTRNIAGARAEFIIDKDKTIGLNFSHGQDLQNSIRPDLQQFGLTPLKNEVGSVDTRLTFHRILTVDGEFAYSATDFDERLALPMRKDYGGRLDTNLRVGRFFLRTSYVRLMPNFLAVNARQLADLQDTMLRAGIDLTDRVTVEAAYRRTNNNLSHQRDLNPDGSKGEGTTTFEAPEVRFSFRRIPGLGRTILDVGYRDRLQTGPVRLVDPSKGVLESRRVPTPFAEVALPLGGMLISVAWERRFNDNAVLPSEKTTANHISGSLRGNFTLGRWNFSPMGRYEMETEDFFRVYGFNTNRSILASTYIDAPRYFSFEGTYRVLGASLFAECLQVAGGPSCAGLVPSLPGTTVLLPSGYRRPAFHGAVTFKLRNSEDRFIVLSFDQNMNFFALPGRAFRERIEAITFVYRLRR